MRKEPKGHGTGQWIEGLSALRARRAKVAIVEDVVTTGASTLKAIERARSEGLEPVGAFALVDRQEGGREAIEATGVTVHALFVRGDFPHELDARLRRLARARARGGRLRQRPGAAGARRPGAGRARRRRRARPTRRC